MTSRMAFVTSATSASQIAIATLLGHSAAWRGSVSRMSPSTRRMRLCVRSAILRRSSSTLVSRNIARVSWSRCQAVPSSAGKPEKVSNPMTLRDELVPSRIWLASSRKHSMVPRYTPNSRMSPGTCCSSFSSS